MSTQTDLPEVLPAAAAPAALPAPSVTSPVRPLWDRWPLSWIRFLVGWAWRLAVGAFFCANPFVLALGVGTSAVVAEIAPEGTNAVLVLCYFTAIFAVGWTYRWMQAVVLRGWWKRSPRRREGTFARFCDTLGPGAFQWIFLVE